MSLTDGVRVCHGDETGVGATDLRLKSFDGAPLALYITLPSSSSPPPKGGCPVVVQSHGWGDPRAAPATRNTVVRRPINGRATAMRFSSSPRGAGVTRAAPLSRGSMAAVGTAYAEVTVTPTAHLDAGLRANELAKALDSGARRARPERG